MFTCEQNAETGFANEMIRRRSFADTVWMKISGLALPTYLK